MLEIVEIRRVESDFTENKVSKKTRKLSKKWRKLNLSLP